MLTWESFGKKRGAWRVRSRGILCLAVAVMGLVVGLGLSSSGALVSEGHEETLFTVATYNTLFLFDGIADSEFRDTPRSACQAQRHAVDVAEVISRIDPDFVVLQEVERESDSLRVAESLDHPYESVFVEGYASIGQDTCALSRVPIDRFGRSWDAQAYPIPDSVLDCASGIATGSKHFWAEARVGGVPVTIVGIHLTAWTLVCERAVIREAEALVIRQIVRDALDRGREVILLGDFNDHDGDVLDKAGSLPISQVFQLLKDVDPAKPGDELLNVADRLPRSDRYTGWWDKNNNKFDDGGIEHTQIDTILVSEGLWDRIDEVGIDHSTYAHEVSDHWPIYVKFEMPEPVQRIEDPPAEPTDRPLVLFDEAHSESLSVSRERLMRMENPQWSEILDTKQALRLELRYAVDTIDGSIDAERLASGSVLVLAGTRERFTEEETDAIEAFVRRGGGLLVLSSWGNGSANDVLERFDLRFLPGVIRTPTGDWGPEAFWAIVQEGHAVTDGVEDHHVNGSQALIIPDGVDRLLTSLDDAWCDADMDGVQDSSEASGSLTIGAAMEIEDGRVVVIGDTAFHDDAWRENEGSRALIMNALEWLEGASSRSLETAETSGFVEPTLILHNGVVVTMVSEDDMYEAIAIRGERILSLGSNDEILALSGPETELIDLEGTAVYPGFIDPHTHLFNNRAARDLSLDQIQQFALENGITTAANMFTTQDHIEEYIDYAEDGLMRMRMHLYLIHNDSCGTVWGDWYQNYPAGAEVAPQLEVGGVKMFAEYSVCGDRGARPVFSPWAEQYMTEFADSRWSGRRLLFTPDAFEAAVRDAQSLGYQVAVHAMGDAGIELTLDAFDAALGGGPNTHRHMILHNSVIRDDLLSRYAELDVVALIEPPSSCRTKSWRQFFDDPVIDLFMRWDDLTSLGVHVAIDSDWPWYGDDALHPMKKLASLTTRGNVLTPYAIFEPCPIEFDRRIGIWRGLQMMTTEAAYALRCEDERGSLAPGMLADLVVLSADPQDSPPEAVGEIAILLTMVGGRVEYEKPSSEISASPSVILHGGVVVTMVSEDDTYEAIAIQGEQILALGSDEEILALAGPKTEQIDLNGRAVFPGFIDAHTHFLQQGIGHYGSREEAEREALRQGVTTMGEMFTSEDDLETWTREANAGELLLRHSLYLIHNDSCGDVKGPWYVGYRTGQAVAPNLEIGGVKAFAELSICGDRWAEAVYSDEILSAAGASAIERYGERSVLLSVEDLADVLRDAQDGGLQVAIHSIGDAGTDLCLDALEQALDVGPNSMRHVILHNAFLRDDQVDRYIDLGVLAAVEPFAPCLESYSASRLGEQIFPIYHRWRDLIDRGIPLALDSDFPFFGWQYVNPMERLATVVTGAQRFDLEGVPEDCGEIQSAKLSPWQGLRAMTADAAYVLHHDHDLGTLEPGKLADLAVLSGNPLTLQSAALTDIEVHLTMVGGRIAYESPIPLERTADSGAVAEPDPATASLQDSVPDGVFYAIDGFSEGADHLEGWWGARRPKGDGSTEWLELTPVWTDEGWVLGSDDLGGGITSYTRGFQDALDASDYLGVEIELRSNTQVAIEVTLESFDEAVPGEWPVKESVSSHIIQVLESWTIVRLPFESFSVAPWLLDDFPNVVPETNRAAIHEVHVRPLGDQALLEIRRLGFYASRGAGVGKPEEGDPIFAGGALGRSPHGVEVVQEMVYVIDWETGVLHIIDASSGARREFPTDAFGVADLAFDGELLWLITESGSAWTFDPEGERIESRSLDVALHGEVLGVEYAADTLYLLVLQEGGQQLCEIPAAGDVEWFPLVAPREAGEFLGLQVIDDSPGDGFLTLDAATGMIYRIDQAGAEMVLSPHLSVHELVAPNSISGRVVGFFFEPDETAWLTSIGNPTGLHRIVEPGLDASPG